MCLPPPSFILLVCRSTPYRIHNREKEAKREGSCALCNTHRDHFEGEGFKFTSLIDMSLMYFWREEIKRERKGKVSQLKNEANRRKQNETKKERERNKK